MASEGRDAGDRERQARADEHPPDGRPPAAARHPQRDDAVKQPQEHQWHGIQQGWRDAHVRAGHYGRLLTELWSRTLLAR